MYSNVLPPEIKYLWVIFFFLQHAKQENRAGEMAAESFLNEFSLSF